MKILIVNNMAPFIWGGAEELAFHLKNNLIKAGYESEILRIPFQWEPAEGIPSQMLMVRTFELFNVDRVIALKFPAYLIRHPHKTLWLLHQYRQAYDLYDAKQSNIPAGNKGQEIRKMIKKADDQSLLECKKVFTISDVTKSRLMHYNNFTQAEILYTPLNDSELFSGGASQGYIFAGGRMNFMKRQHLLLEALALTPKKVKLIIAGPPDSPEYADKLKQLVENLQLSDRVKLDLRFLSRKELAQYVNQSIACAYLPLNEDGLGYMAMEAVSAKKPLISCLDSGGVLNLVQHLETGWLCFPNPPSLAESMIQVYKDQKNTKEMGLTSHQNLMNMNISWPHTIQRLLS